MTRSAARWSGNTTAHTIIQDEVDTLSVSHILEPMPDRALIVAQDELGALLLLLAPHRLKTRDVLDREMGQKRKVGRVAPKTHLYHFFEENLKTGGIRRGRRLESV